MGEGGRVVVEIGRRRGVGEEETREVELEEREPGSQKDTGGRRVRVSCVLSTTASVGGEDFPV